MWWLNWLLPIPFLQHIIKRDTLICELKRIIFLKLTGSFHYRVYNIVEYIIIWIWKLSAQRNVYVYNIIPLANEFFDEVTESL